MQYVLFTDNLSDLNGADAVKAAKQAGFDGIDLTLRPGGHVLPDHAEIGLAQLKQAADALAMDIPMASTSITDMQSPHADAIFASCAHYGVRKIKLGYWPYQPFGSLAKQLREAQRKLKQLVKLGRKYDVLPCVHVHSGPTLSNGGPILYQLLQDFQPSEAGAYVDPMHMTVEGGSSGWEMGLDLLAPWIALVGVKNFRWLPTDRDPFGQQQYRWEYTPLADGQAPLPQFFRRLKELRYDGIVSLHSEYKGGSSFRRLTTPELLRQSTVDLKYLRSVVANV